MATLAALVVASVVVSLYYLLKIGRREAGLPPGPPTLPLLGNLLSIPTKNAHFQFTAWGKQYGGIYSLKLFHTTAIVLSDRRLVRELIDKRGATYNSRPPFFFAEHYIARDPANIPLVVFMPSGDKWRLCRKLYAQCFNEAKVEKEYVEIVEAESRQMVHDFWHEPGGFMMHTLRFSNSIIKSLVYGTRTRHADELQEYTVMFEKYVELLEVGAIPPVDLLPWLVYVPQWMWRGRWKNWKNKGDESGQAVNSVFTKMAEPVLERRRRGVRAGSVYDFLLDEGEKGINLTRRDLDTLAGSLIDAGSDTTASAIRVFIQAMIKYPGVQERAHRHVDEVVGSKRSPMWSDVAKLPYVVQIIKEVMRWRPVASIMPHHSTADDTIDGYFIPKNTTVLINVWDLNHSPADINTCESPMSDFDPDRYTTRIHASSHYAASPDIASRDHYTYGAGRRICPGMHLAERSLFIAIAKLLWAFEFKEKPGRPVDVDPETGFMDGIVRTPKNFECEIRVRQERQEILENEFAEERNVLGRYEV
ncbi:Cytochrome P450 monooxygenase [Alternaria gaisen]|uniref:Cytochrome P450 monooxygenase n=1 Tax=Alternaria gaisen TaxID=167740 RepID=A0ACB6FAU5_9PLEO|nr:Cytochrome P450 monooxygenase [Alternaria gaisen]